MSKDIKKVVRCRICKSKNLTKFFDMGKMPLPNGFLKPEELKHQEKKYPLACLFCNNCNLMQLTHVVNPKVMFTNYLYIPSTAKVRLNNFNNLVYQTKKLTNLKKDSLIVDIGSNDGTLLSYFKRQGAKVLGIDPAKNLIALAAKNGVPTINKLFTPALARKITKKYGYAKAITATNVIAHIDNLHKLLKGVNILLNKDGVFVTEFPYSLDLITKSQFDTIYHEHLSYFLLKPWTYLINKYNLEIIDIRRLQIDGGAIRITHAKKGSFKKTAAKTVNYLISLEKNQGLYKPETYIDFAESINSLKNDVRNTLINLKKEGKRIAGYGAPAKGNILTNFFEIGNNLLDYIVDSIPQKHGYFTPGQHIPIFPEAKLFDDTPDFALILAWNYADEIIAKQRLFRKKGGRFIIPIPKVKIV